MNQAGKAKKFKIIFSHTKAETSKKISIFAMKQKKKTENSHTKTETFKFFYFMDQTFPKC